MMNEKCKLRDKLKAAISGNVRWKSKTLYIWGIGNTALLYQEGLGRLKNAEMEFAGYVDNNHKFYGGGVFCGKPVYAPEFLLTVENPYVLICTPQPLIIAAISEQLKKMRVEHCHIDKFILSNHVEEVMQCFDMMEDERSRQTYCEIICARTEGRLPDENTFCENQYMALPEFVRYGDKEVFVDCGAYVGDTVEQFIERHFGIFGKIIAFESDKKNYTAATKRIGRLKEEWGLESDKITIYLYGVADRNNIGKVQSYDANKGLGSKIMESDEIDGDDCQIVAVDSFIKEPFTFLKADIESFEYKMLLGAQRSIAQFKPKLAVCIYHNAVDLYSIPLLIKKIMPEYKIACRHHSYELYDTVLYGWI